MSWYLVYLAVPLCRFHSIPVESYGTISNIAQVTLKSASKVSITVFDPEAVKKVADAIRASSDLNLNPIIDGSTMEVNIPKPSKETREATVKSMHKVAEKVGLFSTLLFSNMYLLLSHHIK